MQKKFLSNLVLLMAVNLLIKPFWVLGIDRTVQNAVGLDAYGQYASLFGFSLLFSVLLDFGIQNFNSASLARDHSLIRSQFPALLFLKLMLAAGFGALTFIAGWVYGFTSYELYLLALLIVNQVLASFYLFIRSNISGLQLYKTDSLLSAADRFFMIILCALMIWTHMVDVNITHFIYAQGAGYLLAVIAAMVVVTPHLSGWKFEYDKALVKELWQKTYPFALLALIMMLYTKADVLLIKRLMPDGDFENGIYAQSIRLLDAANMFTALISGMLLPMFANMLKEKKSLTPLVKLAMLVMLVPSIMGVVYCYVHSDYIMELLYKSTNDYNSLVFEICISSAIPYCVIYIFGTLLTAKGKMRILIFTAAFAFVLNLVANIILIPRFGAQAAAGVALATHSLVAVLNLYFCLRTVPLRISFTHLVKFPVFAFLCLGTLLVLTNNGGEGMSAGIIYVLAGLVFVVVLQIIDLDTMKRALKRFSN
jgi:O-antigen/teichoic acid export membrane protein